MAQLETALRAVRDGGGRAFVPYVTGGYPGVDAGLLRALADAGADAIEVGIPHSDPIIDGAVVQEASRVALERGSPSFTSRRAAFSRRRSLPPFGGPAPSGFMNRGYRVVCGRNAPGEVEATLRRGAGHEVDVGSL